MHTQQEKPHHLVLHMCCKCMKRGKVVFQDAFSFSKRRQNVPSQNVFIPICQACNSEIKHGKKFWSDVLAGSCVGVVPLLFIGMQEPVMLLPGFLLLLITVVFAWMMFIFQDPITITSQSILFSNKKYQRIFDEAELIGQCVDGTLFVLPHIKRKNKVEAGIFYDQQH